MIFGVSQSRFYKDQVALFTLVCGVFFINVCSRLKLNSMARTEKANAKWFWFEPLLLGAIVIADKVEDLSTENLYHLYSFVFGFTVVRYVTSVADVMRQMSKVEGSSEATNLVSAEKKTQ